YRIVEEGAPSPDPSHRFPFCGDLFSRWLRVAHRPDGAATNQPRATPWEGEPMAKARAIIKRRKSIQNIRKITRTMELIATNRFRKALNRATEAEAFTRKIAELVADLGETSQEVTHPLLVRRDPIRRSLLLVLASNRGLAGAYNGNVLRAAIGRL